jgi:hypothetical protein
MVDAKNMDPTSRHHSKSLLAGVAALMVVVATVLTVAGAELTARFREPKPVARPDMAQLDPSLGWIPRPGTWRVVTPEFTNDWSVDSLTMNDREVTSADLQARVRIIALGDSHTFAIGASVTEAWPKRLEARLIPDGRVVVWNAGVIGYSVVQYLDRFRTLQPKLHANLVLVGFSMATDLYDLIPPERGGFVYGDNAERDYYDLGPNKELVHKHFNPRQQNVLGEANNESRDQSVKIRGFLEEHLALYRIFKRSNLAMWIATHYKPGGKSLWPGLDTALRIDLTEDDKYRWTLMEKVMGLLVQEANASGAKVVVVNIPYLAQVYDDVWTWSFGSRPEEFDRWIAGKRLGEACARVGAGYIDTTDAFVEATRKSNRWLHWRQDAHPTPEGQDLIAQVIADTFKKTAIVQSIMEMR